MKLCCVVAVAVLVVALCSQAKSQGSAGPDVCCFNYYPKRLPEKRMKSYKITHPNCPKKGVIFTTVGNKAVCANPEDQQTQVIMEKLDKLWVTEPTPSSR
ncbi:C-C motif chemokine 4 homolog [Clupea harengus]|uniref:C-C motif chemokine n=1 Tax=Clupea harengus TaxID=7950 RepID=A0A6P8GKD1_CLUHA|nr:C-C motif chemokine 4 homolog [Clupea harengus]